jgi:hypothetical protein
MNMRFNVFASTLFLSFLASAHAQVEIGTPALSHDTYKTLLSYPYVSRQFPLQLSLQVSPNFSSDRSIFHPFHSQNPAPPYFTLAGYNSKECKLFLDLSEIQELLTTLYNRRHTWTNEDIQKLTIHHEVAHCIQALAHLTEEDLINQLNLWWPNTPPPSSNQITRSRTLLSESMADVYAFTLLSQKTSRNIWENMLDDWIDLRHERDASGTHNTAAALQLLRAEQPAEVYTLTPEEIHRLSFRLAMQSIQEQPTLQNIRPKR